MTELLTAAQMRAIEQAAIDSGEVTGLELMERAGQGVVDAIFEIWPELAKTSHRAVLLCGPGNNGGDGFVVARLLKEWGWEVEVFLYGDAEKLPVDAKVNHERWVETGHVTSLVSDYHQNLKNIEKALLKDPTTPPQFDVLIEALFGIGLSRPIENGLQQTISLFEASIAANSKHIAIDVQCGVCANSGKPLAAQNWSIGPSQYDLTVTFHRPKLAHYLAPIRTNRLIEKNIGLESLNGSLSADTRQLLQAMFDQTERMSENSNNREAHVDFVTRTQQSTKSFHEVVELVDGIDWEVDKSETCGDHKFSHGHALMASGPATKTGAARLAARGALRIGAGLVTVASPTNALQENAAHLTAIMLRETNTLEQFQTLLSDDRISSICIGPGFARVSEQGTLDFEHTRAMVKAALNANKPIVLDADALTAFKDAPEELFKQLHEHCVLTPHGGEFKRLFPDIHAKLNAPATTGPAYSKVDATRDAAARAGCTVLFKGADTIIVYPNGRASINSAHYDRAAPWLATAGSGDVLAGFITGLLARGLAPMQAAETAARLHVECALKFGAGLIAEDIAEQLPAVFTDLGL